ncbi:fructokinase [Bradyrhizobium japonicum]
MLIACGDALIDFVPTRNTEGREAVMPAVGGSCLNVAIGMARLGAPTGFVGGVSTDMFGRMIADHATASNVELGLATRSDRQTTLAFVRIVAGESHYAFYDAETATRNWTYRRGTIPFANIEAVHVGSTTLVNDQGAAETKALIADARASSTISFDPNCRPNLVKNKPAYLARMAEFAGQADLIKMSDVDFAYLFGEEPHEQRAKLLLGQGTSLVVITRGNNGAIAWHAGSRADRSSGAEGRDRRHHWRRRQFSGCAPVRPAQAGPHQPAAAERHRRGRASPRAVLCRQLRRHDLYPPGRRSAVEP